MPCTVVLPSRINSTTVLDIPRTTHSAPTAFRNDRTVRGPRAAGSSWLPTTMAPVLAPMQHPLGPESMGSLLRAAFEHVTVVSLKANGHRKWFSGMLEGQLGLHPSRDFSFVDGVDCSNWGRWEHQLLREKRPWLQPRTCDDGMHESPVGCLASELSECRTPGPRAVADCSDVCSSLAVASALHVFLKSDRKRTLLIQDNICPTTALMSAEKLLTELSRTTWSMVKLGHCYSNYAFGPVYDHASCAVGSSDPHPVATALLGGMGTSFCSHAIALVRIPRALTANGLTRGIRAHG